VIRYPATLRTAHEENDATTKRPTHAHLFAFVLILVSVLALPEVKGWIGEKTTSFRMALKLDSAMYRRVDNVIVPTSTGTTQIDHIVVSPFGVFVIETKNMKGWIFGGADQGTWTQTLYREKHKFQNLRRTTDMRAH
jgi:restriction system protein